MFEKCDSLIDSKNEWLLLPASFMAKFGLVFNTGKRKTLFLEVSF